MTRAYSEDLHRRVIGAIEAGASCRQAARRYDIVESTAIRSEHGQRGRRGGERRSHRIEAQAALILAAVDDRGDITLAER